MSKLPLGWNRDRLKDVALINASSLSADTDPDFEFDYLEISNVDYSGVIDRDAIEHIRFEDAPSRARRRTVPNCTVISSVRPNLQAIAFLEDGRPDLICSTGFNVVQAREPRLVPRFAYYVLISEGSRQYLEATATGVGYPAVADKDFNALSVSLPPRSEQERIAEYLDDNCAAIDAAMARKQKQIETLNVFRRSMIEHAVTRGTGRNPALKRVHVDWLNEIPSHWEVCRLKRVLTRVDYGTSGSTNEEGRHPVLKMGHIQNGEIIFDNLDYVDEIESDLLLETGDLLYNRTNSPDQVGKAAIFRKSRSDEVTFASYLVRLRTNYRASPWFLNYVLNSDGFLGFARRLAIPSVQQSNLNSTRYSRIFIPLPPRSEQEAIRTFLDTKIAESDRVVAIIERQIETLLAYRKSLIHECVTGKRRTSVKEANRIAAYA